ncbi:MAG: hypothetical protein V5A84_01430, partial [Planctomycetota bacterium]
LDTNHALAWDLDKLAEDPYEEGWLLEIKVHETDQLKDLLTPQAYRDYCQEQTEEESGDDEQN